MMIEGGTGISIEELSATPAWESLRPSIKRILADALQSRDLRSAVANSTVGISPDVQELIIKNLAKDPAVIAVVMLYALGVAPESEAKPAEPAPIATGGSAAPSVTAAGTLAN